MADKMDEKLISFVFQYEILYDMGYKYYHDTTRKDNAWEEIGQNLEIPGQAGKKRWNALRDCYRKTLNRKKTVSGQKAVNIAPWKYEEQMSVLKAHVSQKRPQKSNLEDIGTQDENPDAGTYGEGASGDITAHEFEEDDAVLSNSDIISPTPERVAMEAPSKKRKCTPTASAHDIISTYFASKNSARDHLTAYFKMVEETVRTFPPLQQVEIKARISSLLSEYEYKNLSSAQSHSHHPSPSPTFPGYSSTHVPSHHQLCQVMVQHSSRSHYHLL